MCHTREKMKKRNIVGIIVNSVSSIAIGGVVGYVVAKKEANKDSQEELNRKQLRINKFYDYFQLTNHWLMLKNSGKSLEKFFADKGVRTIAIYGMGELGHRLAEELENGTSIEIKYAIDRKEEAAISDYEVVSIDSELQEVDMIVVTPLFDYYAIEERLHEVCDYEIVSLEEVIDYLD